MPDSPTPGADGPGTEQRPARGLSARLVRTLSAVLALVALAAVASAVWFALKAHENDQTQQQRAAASTVASQFALRMDKVDGADFDNYIKGVNELLTTKARTKNGQVFDAMEQTYAAAKVKGSGKVLLTAVGDADDDSATVLVVHDSDVTSTQGDVDHHYRWSVSLVKVKGSWLVDDFNPVN